MNCCDYNCNQGRDCPARAAKTLRNMTDADFDAAQELPITMEDEPFSYDWVMEFLRDLLAIVGAFFIVGMLAFWCWGRT